MLAIDGGVSGVCSRSRHLQRSKRGCARDFRAIAPSFLPTTSTTSPEPAPGPSSSRDCRVACRWLSFASSTAPTPSRCSPRVHHPVVQAALQRRAVAGAATGNVRRHHVRRRAAGHVVDDGVTQRHSGFAVAAEQQPERAVQWGDREDSNLRLPMWQLARTSTAALVYFPPEKIRFGSKNFVFVDGGPDDVQQPRLSPVPAIAWGRPHGVSRHHPGRRRSDDVVQSDHDQKSQSGVAIRPTGLTTQPGPGRCQGEYRLQTDHAAAGTYPSPPGISTFPPA